MEFESVILWLDREDVKNTISQKSNTLNITYSFPEQKFILETIHIMNSILTNPKDYTVSFKELQIIQIKHEIFTNFAKDKLIFKCKYK
jgi:hypothetical protein